MMKKLSALLLSLALLAAPAHGANQAPVQTPTTGPHSATDFTTNYLNPALLALFTCNWGPTAPINGPGIASMQYQCWFDTSAAPDVAFKYYDGTSFVLAGRLNTSTHVWSVADADLHCIEILATTGLIARTGAGTCLARSVTGTASEITVTNGDGVSGQPTISLPAAMVFTGKTVTGGAYSAITGFGIRSTGAAFDVRFAATEVLTADRTLTWVLGDANRSITLSGNISIGGALTTGGALTFSGGFGFTGTLTGTTAVTFPTAGTLATLAGVETFTNKTINCANNTCTVRIGSDVSGLGTGVASWLATASSANLAAALTDETGTGAAVFGTAPTISAPVITGIEDHQGVMRHTGISSPAQIVANQNDYNPGSVICATAGVLRLNSDASRNITGLAAGTSGCEVDIQNVGSNPIVLKDADAGSSAVNRFALGGDANIAANNSFAVRYDNTTQRWRALVSSGAAAGGGVSSVACAEGATCTTITTSGTVKTAFSRHFMLGGM